MHTHTALVAGALALALCGCASQVPHSQRFPASTQLLPKASKHWETMADDIAAQAKESLDRIAPGANRTVYVAQSAQRSVFSQAFHDFLVTRMVNRGIPVSRQPHGALRFEYQTRVVRHGSERSVYYPGTLTALTGGLLVARNIVEHGIGKPGIAALGIAADIAASHLDGTQPSKLELIVTASIVDEGRYLMHRSDIYYLDEADAGLFAEPPRDTPMKQYQVLGVGT